MALIVDGADGYDHRIKRLQQRFDGHPFQALSHENDQDIKVWVSKDTTPIPGYHIWIQNNHLSQLKHNEMHDTLMRHNLDLIVLSHHDPNHAVISEMHVIVTKDKRVISLLSEQDLDSFIIGDYYGLSR